MAESAHGVRRVREQLGGAWLDDQVAPAAGADRYPDAAPRVGNPRRDAHDLE
jgi:hypothetical protein